MRHGPGARIRGRRHVSVAARGVHALGAGVAVGRLLRLVVSRLVVSRLLFVSRLLVLRVLLLLRFGLLCGSLAWFLDAAQCKICGCVCLLRERGGKGDVWRLRTGSGSANLGV